MDLDHWVDGFGCLWRKGLVPVLPACHLCLPATTCTLPAPCLPRLPRPALPSCLTHTHTHPLPTCPTPTCHLPAACHSSPAPHLPLLTHPPMPRTHLPHHTPQATTTGTFPGWVEPEWEVIHACHLQNRHTHTCTPALFLPWGRWCRYCLVTCPFTYPTLPAPLPACHTCLVNFTPFLPLPLGPHLPPACHTFLHTPAPFTCPTGRNMYPLPPHLYTSQETEQNRVDHGGSVSSPMPSTCH